MLLIGTAPARAAKQTNGVFEITHSWRFQTNNLDGTGWEKRNYVDTSWPMSNGLFFIENASLPAPKSTPLPPRVGDARPLTTYYFRKTFFLTDVTRVSSLTFSNLVDDGAVYYLNGMEVMRVGMPAGLVTNGTYATREVGDATAYDVFSVSGAGLVEGLNVLAVEVHQATATSSDVVFGCGVAEVRRIPPYASATPIGPPDGGTNNGNQVRFWAQVSGVESTNVTVNVFARPLMHRPDFTLAVLGDTQFYTSGVNGGKPETFVAQTEWILSNQVPRNIVMVTHLGDCVNYGDNTLYEWRHATNALYRLEDPFRTQIAHGIPYSVAVGNHEGQATGAYFYNLFFGVTHFSGRDYYGGHHGANNNNHYLLFSSSGLDFILLNLEFAAGTNAATMNWANETLQAFRNRRAIVVSHSLLYQGTNQLQLPFSPEGEPIYHALKANSNIFLMLCGHDPQGGRRTEVFNGNTINIVRADYENETNGGNGWMRTMEFSPSNNVIRVKTFSPTLQQFRTGGVHQFTLPCALTDFPMVASITNAPPGFVSTPEVGGFLPGISYEWYTEVRDGEVRERSPTVVFTMAGGAGPRPAGSLQLGIVAVNHLGQTFLRWNTVGGRRYRLEYSDGDPQGGWNGQFTEIVRSQAAETSAESPGTPGTANFIDDFTHTGGPPLRGTRFYRLREIVVPE